MNTPLARIDAGTFQKQLIQLAETVAQKINRKAPGLLPGVPAFVSFDPHILTRQATHTYDLFFYLNADERCEWVGFSPKRLARIMRFQALLEHVESSPSGCSARVAAELGYFDQAQLANEVALFAGTSPGRIAPHRVVDFFQDTLRMSS